MNLTFPKQKIVVKFTLGIKAINFGFTPTQMCVNNVYSVKKCSVKKKSQAYYQGGIQTQKAVRIQVNSFPSSVSHDSRKYTQKHKLKVNVLNPDANLTSIKGTGHYW